MRIELLTHQERSCLAVDDFVAVKAPKPNRNQQISNSSVQQVQQQSLGINKIQQISISSGIWFGTRGSEVQILSPRPNILQSINCGVCEIRVRRVVRRFQVRFYRPTAV